MNRKRTSKFKQGIYRCLNRDKYKGNADKILYRSAYELKAFRFMDHNFNIVEWSSEETIIPYQNPLTGRVHRYFVDLYAKIKSKDGSVKKYLIEIKPSVQTLPPKPGKNTKSLLRRQAEYVKNRAKWDAAIAWGKKKGYEFQIITEKELGL